MKQAKPSDVYMRLSHRLTELATGYPAVSSGVHLRILAELFTERDAELFLYLDMRQQSVEALASKSDTDVTRLASELEDMARRGLVYQQKHATGFFYRAMPFIEGLYEYVIGREREGFARDMRKYYMTGLSESLFQTITPPVRSLPINNRLVQPSETVYYDDARAIIKSRGHIAITNCTCRTMARLNGQSCAHIMEACFKFDEYADYYFRNKMGRYIGTREALAILDQCEKESLVFHVMNSQAVEGLCACCSCCCSVLSGLNHFVGPSRPRWSNHACVLDTSNCIGCGACEDKCPTGALALGKYKIELDSARCIGCGLCIDACIVSALSLRRKPEDKIYTPPENIVKAYECMSRERMVQYNEEDSDT